MTGAAIVRADALRIPLRDATVDLVITSPPYFALRSYRDGDEHYGGQIGSEPTPTAFLCALWAVMDECWRVLKPEGSCWVNLGDKYAGSGGHNNAGISASSTLQGNGHMGGVSKAGEPQKIKRTPRNLPGQASDRSAYLPATRRNAPDRYTQASDVRTKSLMGMPWRFVLGLIDPMTYRTDHYDGETRQWILRAEVVWSKPNGLPESVKDRVRRSHEQWFHLTKEPQYFAGVDEVREPQMHGVKQYAPGWRRFAGGGDAQASGAFDKDGGFNDYRKASGVQYNPLGKLPGSVWSIASQPLRVPVSLGVDHFAAFPAEWPRRIIAGWSPAGAVVLDPFAGTGTVAMMARAMGRYGVNVDLSRDYNRLARWRIFESGHGERALAKAATKRKPAPKPRRKRVQAIERPPTAQLQLSLSDPTMERAR